MFGFGCFSCRRAEVEEVAPGEKSEFVEKDEYDDGSTILGTSNSSSSMGSLRSLDARALLSLSRGRRFKLSDFDVGATVGVGAFGRVHVVQLKEHEERPMALKVMGKAKLLKMQQVEHVKNEMDIMRMVEHPYIVNLVQTFQDETRVYMLMEFVNGGELNSLIKVNDRLHDSHAKIYAAQLTSALGYLHSLEVAFRDLKPENVLIDSRGCAKLADFGFAKLVPDKTYTMCGTPEYVAPEVIRVQGHGPSVDCWALGVLVYEMLHGSTPFRSPSVAEVYEKVLAMQVPCPAHFSPDARSLVKGLVAWRVVRLGGPSGDVEDIKNHAWFQEISWRDVIGGEIQPPWVPPVSGPGDTSLFGNYKESMGSPVEPSSEEQEKFNFICWSEESVQIAV